MTQASSPNLPERARVVVVGIGYVGLPLVVELANAGFHAIGRVRISSSAEPVRMRKALPPNILKVLAVASDQRSAAEREGPLARAAYRRHACVAVTSCESESSKL